MLKIVRSTNDASVMLTLIGRIEGENLEELKRLYGVKKQAALTSFST